ncbi:MAG: flavodoxin family protein [Victivallaceae bacterium]|nr:flavodoxin family protein [Victivallaceae bacterium]
MDKLLIIQGSPRKKGNTEFCCNYVRERLAAKFEADIINLYDYRIRHCTGCRGCMKKGSCVIQDDDFEFIRKQVFAADIIIQASPVYWYSPPGIMKDFIDRMHGTYICKRPLNGKRGAMITVATEAGFEHTAEILACWLRQYGAEIVENARINACEPGDVAANPANLTELNRLCESLMV